MTVGELRKALEGVPDDRLVLIGDDREAVDAVEIDVECGAGEETPACLITVSQDFGKGRELSQARSQPTLTAIESWAQLAESHVCELSEPERRSPQYGNEFCDCLASADSSA